MRVFVSYKSTTEFSHVWSFRCCGKECVHMRVQPYLGGCCWLWKTRWGLELPEHLCLYSSVFVVNSALRNIVWSELFSVRQVTVPQDAKHVPAEVWTKRPGGSWQCWVRDFIFVRRVLCFPLELTFDGTRTWRHPLEYGAPSAKS